MPLKIAPQISFFQAPILEICPLLEKIMSLNWTYDSTVTILQEFQPLIDNLSLPIKRKKNYDFSGSASEDDMINSEHKSAGNIMSNQPTGGELLGKKRLHFDKIHDNLLNIGLHIYGKHNLELINKYWLESKTLQEIKHRIKNLTCNKASDNIIKKFKKFSETPLSEEEFHALVKGMQWFGINNKWVLLSKYFLPERTPEYIENVLKIIVDNGFLKEHEYLVSSYKKRRKKKKDLTSFEQIIVQLASSYSKELQEIPAENENGNKVFYTPDQNYDKYSLPDPLRPIVKRRYNNATVIFQNDNDDCYETIELDK